MQITRQADYALRAIYHLTKLDPTQRAATSQIAEEQRIPPSFLAKIISQLSIAGLIHTSRGARGGVSLARSPEEITILEVVEAIDGPIALNECTSSPDACPFGENCPLRKLWCGTQTELIEKLATTTFAQFMSEASSPAASSN
ncbi:transcriptional regulator, BadM/Rrf2 family [Longilinea arvoryzae]|uniref:Transcriptional regulator, BadM/Rrf2 family n=1 Tax=Longilinea arvoryzae TaxID=360412 RepID=A0A0S7B6J3_9CHLR|nr:Rrf2 family transcriptional regulator [Longilinea arvoryzae]GAP12542.1 transcriptional regulator, BadM/Rrf2 family [Longilinea arvoryzae]